MVRILKAAKILTFAPGGETKHFSVAITGKKSVKYLVKIKPVA